MASIIHMFNMKSKAFDEPNTVRMLDNAISLYVSRMGALASMIALAAGTRKINDHHVRNISALFVPNKPHQRGPQQGGTVMASDFFGYPHDAYGRGALDANTKTLNFAINQARPPIHIHMSGGSHTSLLKDLLQDSFTKYDTSITQTALISLIHIIDLQINTLLLAVQKAKSSKAVSKLLHSKTFSMFA